MVAPCRTDSGLSSEAARLVIGQYYGNAKAQRKRKQRSPQASFIPPSVVTRRQKPQKNSPSPASPRTNAAEAGEGENPQTVTTKETQVEDPDRPGDHACPHTLVTSIPDGIHKHKHTHNVNRWIEA